MPGTAAGPGHRSLEAMNALRGWNFRNPALIWLALLGCWLARPTGSCAQTPTPDSGLAVLAAVEQATVAAIAAAERSVVAIARLRRNQMPAAQVDQLRLDQFRLGDP